MLFVQKIEKSIVLGFVRRKSKVVADIISPILTERNLKVLAKDEWFRIWLKEQKLSNKIGKEVKKKFLHKKKRKGRVNTVNMKICIEIEDINVAEISRLISAMTSPTVGEITKDIVTVDNIAKALEDQWVQRNLVKFIKNMTCKKIKDDNGDVKEKIKVKNLVNIVSINKANEGE